jgi:hypothetical protein
MKLAKLKDDWKWVEVGKFTDSGTDYHCWPAGSGEKLVKIRSKFKVTKTLAGMIVRHCTPMTLISSESFSAALR